MHERAVGLEQPLVYAARIAALALRLRGEPIALLVEEAVLAALAEHLDQAHPLRLRVRDVVEARVLAGLLRGPRLRERPRRAVRVGDGPAVVLGEPANGVHRVLHLHLPVERLVRHHPQQLVARRQRVVGDAGGTRLALCPDQGEPAPAPLPLQRLLVGGAGDGLALPHAHEVVVLLGRHAPDEQRLDGAVLHVPGAQERLEQVAKVAAHAVHGDEDVEDVEPRRQIDPAAEHRGGDKAADPLPVAHRVLEVAEARLLVGLAVVEAECHTALAQVGDDQLARKRRGAHRDDVEAPLAACFGVPPLRDGAVELLEPRVHLRRVHAEVDAHVSLQVLRHVAGLEREVDHRAVRHEQPQAVRNHAA